MLDFLEDAYVPEPQKHRAVIVRKDASRGSARGGRTAQHKQIIEGLEVDFPYLPYSCQIDFMATTIRALQRGDNALLESPTGTGKTLCLLCATLAWQQKQSPLSFGAAMPTASAESSNARAVAQALLGNGGTFPDAVPPGSSRNGSAGSVAGAEMGGGRPTIFYASRTHSQLSQVVRELRSSATYSRAVSVTVLGSRQQLCVHEHVSTLSTGSAVNHACNALTQTRPSKCRFRNAVPDTVSLSNIGSGGGSGANGGGGCGRKSPPNFGGASIPGPYSSSSSSSTFATSSSISRSNNDGGNEGEKFGGGSGGDGSARDIEELVKFGRDNGMCPYYLTRNSIPGADLILLPYNYLLDPVTRGSLKVNWANSVVIFDEAHNLEGIASDSASAELSSYDLAGAINEIDSCVAKVTSPDFDVASMAASSGGGSNGGGSTPLELQSLLILKQLLLKLEEEIDQVPLPVSNSSSGTGGGVSRPGAWLLDLLARQQVTCGTCDILMKELEKCVALLMEERTLGGPSATLRLENVVKFIRTVFRGKIPEAVRSLAERYRCYVAPANTNQSGGKGKGRSGKGKGRGAFGSAATDKGGGRVLSYWCFCPGIAMEELKALGVRSVLLASGTLAPLPSFAAELRLPFRHRLENPHVIDAERQVWCGVVGKGVTGQTLNSSFQNRESTTYKLELGRTIANFARVVPGGLLVFFPSYPALESAVTAWKAAPGAASSSSYSSSFSASSGSSCGGGFGGSSAPAASGSVWKSLENAKPIVIEPKQASELKQVLADFTERVRANPTKGCMMLAVCRGKVSEGLDFSDGKARAVVVTGIPYAPAKDPKVMLKREQMDKQSKACAVFHSERKKAIKKQRALEHPALQGLGNGGDDENNNDDEEQKLLSGGDWYSQQALRAVNQALGRVIRHKHDWGAILLCDERFASNHHKGCLSSWLRPHVQTFGSSPSEKQQQQQWQQQNWNSNRTSSNTGIPYNNSNSSSSSSSSSNSNGSSSSSSIGMVMSSLVKFIRRASTDLSLNGKQQLQKRPGSLRIGYDDDGRSAGVAVESSEAFIDSDGDVGGNQPDDDGGGGGDNDDESTMRDELMSQTVVIVNPHGSSKHGKEPAAGVTKFSGTHITSGSHERNGDASQSAGTVAEKHVDVGGFGSYIDASKTLCARPSSTMTGSWTSSSSSSLGTASSSCGGALLHWSGEAEGSSSSSSSSAPGPPSTSSFQAWKASRRAKQQTEQQQQDLFRSGGSSSSTSELLTNSMAAGPSWAASTSTSSFHHQNRSSTPPLLVEHGSDVAEDKKKVSPFGLSSQPKHQKQLQPQRQSSSSSSSTSRHGLLARSLALPDSSSSSSRQPSPPLENASNINGSGGGGGKANIRSANESKSKSSAALSTAATAGEAGQRKKGKPSIPFESLSSLRAEASEGTARGAGGVLAAAAHNGLKPPSSSPSSSSSSSSSQQPRDRRVPSPPPATNNPEAIKAFVKRVHAFLGGSNGSQSGGYDSFKTAVKALRQVYAQDAKRRQAWNLPPLVNAAATARDAAAPSASAASGGLGRGCGGGSLSHAEVARTEALDSELAREEAKALEVLMGVFKGKQAGAVRALLLLDFCEAFVPEPRRTHLKACVHKHFPEQHKATASSTATAGGGDSRNKKVGGNGSAPTTKKERLVREAVMAGGSKRARLAMNPKVVAAVTAAATATTTSPSSNFTSFQHDQRSDRHELGRATSSSSSSSSSSRKEAHTPFKTSSTQNPAQSRIKTKVMEKSVDAKAGPGASSSSSSSSLSSSASSAFSSSSSSSSLMRDLEEATLSVVPPASLSLLPNHEPAAAPSHNRSQHHHLPTGAQTLTTGWVCLICSEKDGGVASVAKGGAVEDTGSGTGIDAAAAAAASATPPSSSALLQPLVAPCGHIACHRCWKQWKNSSTNKTQCRAHAAKEEEEEQGRQGSSSSSVAVRTPAMLCPACRAPIMMHSLRRLVKMSTETTATEAGK